MVLLHSCSRQQLNRNSVIPLNKLKYKFLILFLTFQLINFAQNKIDQIEYDETFHFIDSLTNNKPSTSLFNEFYKIAIKYKNSAELSEYIAGKLSDYIERNLGKSLFVLEKLDNDKLSVLAKQFSFGEGTIDIIMDYILNNYLYHKKYFNYFKKYY